MHNNKCLVALQTVTRILVIYKKSLFLNNNNLHKVLKCTRSFTECSIIFVYVKKTSQLLSLYINFQMEFYCNLV